MRRRGSPKGPGPQVALGIEGGRLRVRARGCGDPPRPALPPGTPPAPDSSEKKRVKSRLRRFIIKRPPLQSLQEKGLIRGGDPQLWDLP